MRKYLRLFKENADYQTFLGGGEYIEPHVAVIENNGGVIYKAITPAIPDLIFDFSSYPSSDSGLNGSKTITLTTEQKNFLSNIYDSLASKINKDVDFTEFGRGVQFIFSDITFTSVYVRRTDNSYLFIVPRTSSGCVPIRYYIKATPDIIDLDYICIVHGTDITMADGTTKKIQDISYDDNLMVWDFDNGAYTEAKPLWIKKEEEAIEYYLCEFENGLTLKLVGSNGKCHRLFNYTDGLFESATDCVGKEIYTTEGITKLVNITKVHETVKFYNIITKYHMNLFANSVLTSCRYNNIYPIEDMKFIVTQKRNREDIPNVPYEYITGMRLKEQLFTTEEMDNYIGNLIVLKQN